MRLIVDNSPDGTKINKLNVAAGEINEAHRLARSSAESAIHYAMRCGELLTKQKEKLKHGEWKPWVKANCEFSYPSAAAYMKAARQKSSALDFSSLRQALGYDKGSGNYKANGSGENEWYTPSEYIELANKVMGEIDLDPASNSEANKIIQAKHYFTSEENGLTQEWHGRIWLNPPYSRELMPAFVDKLIEEYTAGHVTEAVLVSHNNTDTQWFQKLVAHASALCFPAKRIKFYRGENVAAPVNGQVFFYLGWRPEKFYSDFAPHGVVLIPYAA